VRRGIGGFNALIAFNAYELLTLVEDDQMRREADELVERLDRRWDGELSSWIDAGETESGSGGCARSTRCCRCS
jgi:hypothetical protein